MRACKLLVAVAAVLGGAGCAGASLVSARAAADLSCPEKDISVSSREMGAYDASGCGKRASYVVRAGEVMADPGGQDDLSGKMPRDDD